MYLARRKYSKLRQYSGQSNTSLFSDKTSKNQIIVPAITNAPTTESLVHHCYSTQSSQNLSYLNSKQNSKKLTESLVASQSLSSEMGDKYNHLRSYITLMQSYPSYQRRYLDILTGCVALIDHTTKFVIKLKENCRGGRRFTGDLAVL